MDEEEFDSLMQSRPFGRQVAMRADVQLRRRMTLGIALWGRTLDDLQRQLLAPSIPAARDVFFLDFYPYRPMHASQDNRALESHADGWQI